VFLRDEAAWAALLRRLNVDGANAPDMIRLAVRDHLRVSPDGQFITYSVEVEWPLPEYLAEILGSWAIIEDAFTGKRIALLPSWSGGVITGPGGATAVSRSFPGRGDGRYPRLITGSCIDGPQSEQPRFILWDLKARAPRAQLWLPGEAIRMPDYSPDGRYVFASSHSPHVLRWWEVTTGKQIGEIIDPPNRHFLDGGRVLVVQSSDLDLLHFWDVTTGRQMPDWELPQPREGTGTISQLEATGGDRYVAVRLDLDLAKKSKSLPVIDELVEELPALRSSRDQRRILVLDLIERRVVGKVRGRYAAFSSDGHWLATIDGEGVVRVWEMPFGRPWGRGAAYAAGLVFGGWFVLALLGKLRRRLWRRRASVEA
jgi:hypothetical protein